MSAVALSKHTRPALAHADGELDFDFDIDVEESHGDASPPAPSAAPEMPLEPQSMRSAILQWLEELA